MNDTFLTCTDALIRCLSDHDLTALLPIYTSRLTQAEQEKSKHVKGEHDNLVTTWRLYQDICDALKQEQNRRSK